MTRLRTNTNTQAHTHTRARVEDKENTVEEWAAAFVALVPRSCGTQPLVWARLYAGKPDAASDLQRGRGGGEAHDRRVGLSRLLHVVEMRCASAPW